MFLHGRKKNILETEISTKHPNLDQNLIQLVMAKSKGKRSSTGDASLSEGTLVDKTSQASNENFISLDAGALANLTRNIEKKLKDGNNPTSKKVQKGTDRGKRIANGASAKHINGKKETSNNNNNKVQTSKQGKKRSRDGQVIEKPTVKDGNAGSGHNEEEDILRQEILALGGSMEDYDLLANVESDSEVEGTTSETKKKAGSNDDALRKELAQLLKGAGQFNPVIPDEEAEDEEQQSESEDGNESDEDEDEEDAPEEDENETEDAAQTKRNGAQTKEVPAPSKVAAISAANAEAQSHFPKEFSRLVCSSCC